MGRRRCRQRRRLRDLIERLVYKADRSEPDKKIVLLDEANRLQKSLSLN